MARSDFPLFRSQLDFAHHLWSLLIHKGSTVVDATCGNGHDALKLANLALDTDKGSLHCIDIQSKAIETTFLRLKSNLPENIFSKIVFHHTSHETFPSSIPSCDLIVYNLGYLPGSHQKDVTTLTDATLSSICCALKLLKKGGAISIMCYPGHEEGEKEEKALLAFCKTLPPEHYLICQHRLINRIKSPNLIFIYNKL